MAARKSPKPIAEHAAAQTPCCAGLPWRAGAVILALALVFGVSAFIIRPYLLPHYWRADDLGPIHINKDGPTIRVMDGEVWVPGGVFWMGSEEFADAQPVHKVEVSPFWMDQTEVTNDQFAQFVAATNYVTVVERWPDLSKIAHFDPSVFGFQPDYVAILSTSTAVGFPGGFSWTGLSGARPMVKPFSLVFSQPKKAVDLRTSGPPDWWRPIAWANWRHPEGPGSDLKGRGRHPVVHICYDDALAYAKWAHKRLPTEAEWEFAARGGLDRKQFAWGDEFRPGGKLMANTWQGDFPNHNTLEDGYQGTAPVGSFPANGFGLLDMAGNVWEWCADWYQPRYMDTFASRNPQGPPDSHDPLEPGVPKRVQRGGSYLCSDNYCMRYKTGGRGKGDPNSSTNHIGFRCVQNGK